MAGFTTAASSSSTAGPSKAASTTSAPTLAQSSSVNTTLAPRPPQKRRINGYGFFYDSEDEAEAIAKQPAPKPLPSTLRGMTLTPNTNTTTVTSFPATTVSYGHGTGIKKLVIEKKDQSHYTTEDLFGVQESKKAANKRASLPNTTSKDARSSRTSPYGKTSPKEKRLRGRHNSSDEEVTPGKGNKFTMRGALETPRRPAPRTPQQVATAPAPTTPAATPAPTARLRSLWHAAANFLASPIRRPAELVREMDSEITPAPPSEDDGSMVGSEESPEEEQENQWPGSYRKTPEPELPPKPAYLNPGLAKDPYASLAPRPVSFGERFIGLQQKKAMSYTVSNDGQKRYWGSRIPRHLLRATEDSESITVANGSKRSRRSYNLTGKTEEQKRQILEELEREIEANRRDRRVSARHDLEKRRVILAQMGVDWAEVEEREKAERGEFTEEEDSDMDITRPRKKGKGKDKEKSKSPEPATPTEPTPPPSRSTSFLFGGETYKAPEVSEAPAVPANVVSVPVAPVAAPVTPVAAAAPEPTAPAPAAHVSAPAAPVSPRRARSPPSTPHTNKVTRKKPSPKKSPPPTPSSLAPPATPTLSHATLPPPGIPWHQNPVYNQPPPPPPTLTSPQKVVSGLSFGDPAHKARTQAEKFKPHVSSGLRASTTAQSDSPPRAAPGINFKRVLHPPEPAAAEPASAPVLKKKFAPLYPLKTKKYGPDGKQIIEVEIDQGYLNKFLELLGRGRSGDEKVLAAVNNAWTPPPVEETRPLYQFFVKVVEGANQPF